MTALQTKAKRAAKRAMQALAPSKPTNRVQHAVSLAEIRKHKTVDITNYACSKGKPVSVYTVRAKQKQQRGSKPLI